MSAAAQTGHVCLLFCAQFAGPMLRPEQAVDA